MQQTGLQKGKSYLPWLEEYEVQSTGSAAVHARNLVRVLEETQTAVSNVPFC